MPNDFSAQIRDWLGKPETGALLDAAARSVLKAMRERRLSPFFLKQERGPADSGDELQEDIRSELALFILENHGGIQERLILVGQNAGFELKTAFIRHWIDKTRNPEIDPRRYLYKRVFDTLRKATEFFTMSLPGKSAAFSMRERSIAIPGLSDEDLGSVPFPMEIIGRATLDAVNRESAILKLARYFWESVCAMWDDKPIRVSVADFTKWVGRHVQIDTPVKVDRAVEDPDGDGQRAELGEPQFNPDRVMEWARLFAGRLTDKEKAIFYLHQGAGLTLDEVAARLAYGSPSGPHYQFDRVKAKLGSYLRDLPWLSPEDLNEEAFSLFLETLISVLKDAAL